MSKHESLNKAYENLPEGMRADIIGGMLHVQASPSYEHQTVIGNMFVELLPLFREGPPGWWITTDVEVAVPAALSNGEDEHLRPDLLGWRKDRHPQPPTGSRHTIIPDWICEVLSTNENYDRTVKMPMYMKMGVGHAWLVHPIKRYVEVYANATHEWTHLFTVSADAVVRLPPFAESSLELAKFWTALVN